MGLRLLACSGLTKTQSWRQAIQSGQARFPLLRGCSHLWLLLYRCRGVLHGGSHSGKFNGFPYQFEEEGSTNQDFESRYSSCQAIWIASRIFSFDFFGSSVKSGSATIQACISVNRTVSGSVSGCSSTKRIAISWVSCQLRSMHNLQN